MIFLLLGGMFSTGIVFAIIMLTEGWVMLAALLAVIGVSIRLINK